MGYKIVTFDGGGVKGVFTLMILSMIIEDIDEGFLDKVDCFAGTSTGALIAAALVKGYHPKDLLRLYTLFGPGIFPRKWHDRQDKAKYSHKLLKTILSKTFSSKLTLADLEKRLIIPACSLYDPKVGRWNHEIFDTHDYEQAKNQKVVDALLKSAAAPIYFPSYLGSMDGGVYAINPSLLAYSRVIDKDFGKEDPQDISILSIGCGINPSYLKENVDWGAKQWMSPFENATSYPLFALLTDIAASVPEYPLQQILGDRYHRINAPLPIPVELDDHSKIDVLVKAAENIRKSSPDLWATHLSNIRKNFLCA